jgi:hypothetical protein
VASGNAQLNFAIRAINEASKVLKEVGGDVDSLGHSASSSGGMLGSFGSTLASVGKIAGGFIVAEGIMKLPGFLMGAAKGAAEDEAATMRLDRALQNYVESAELQGDALQSLNSDMEMRIATGQRLAFSDDDIRDSMQKLIASTDDYAEAGRRQKVAMDLARGAGIPLAQASTLLGKVTEENVNVFKRMGITMKEGATEADVLATITAKFGGQAETYAKSNAGLYEQSKLRMSELVETIGTHVLPIMNKIVTAMVDHVIPAAEQMAEKIGPVAELIGAYFNEIVFPVLRQLGAFFIEHILPRIQQFITAVLPLLRQFAAIVQEKFAEFRVYYEEEIAPALANIMSAFQAIVQWVTDNWPLIIGIIGPIIEQAVNIIRTAFVVLTSLLDAVIQLLQGDFTGAWRAVERAVEAIWLGIENTIKNSTNAIIGMMNVLISAWNRLSFSVNIPFLGPMQVDTPDLPLIPRLAEGGIVRARPGGTLALIGEGGSDEAVIPLNRAGGGLAPIVIHYHQNAPIYGMLDFKTEVQSVLRDTLRGGGFRGLVPS